MFSSETFYKLMYAYSMHIQFKENLQLMPLTAFPTPPLPALPPTVLYGLKLTREGNLYLVDSI